MIPPPLRKFSGNSSISERRGFPKWCYCHCHIMRISWQLGFWISSTSSNLLMTRCCLKKNPLQAFIESFNGQQSICKSQPPSQSIVLGGDFGRLSCRIITFWQDCCYPFISWWQILPLSPELTLESGWTQNQIWRLVAFPVLLILLPDIL